jgi:hypothetical protein
MENRRPALPENLATGLKEEGGDQSALVAVNPDYRLCADHSPWIGIHQARSHEYTGAGNAGYGSSVSDLIDRV